MGRKRPSFYNQNLPQLLKLCRDNGYEYEFKDPEEYQVRVYGATHVIDIWPSRMVYHRVKGEVIRSKEDYSRELDWQFNKEQVSKLLATGEFK